MATEQKNKGRPQDRATDGKRGRVMVKAINLTKRYPHSRAEDVVDAYMRGWNDALDAVQNSKFIINDSKVSEIPTGSTSSKMEQVETEPQTDCAWR